MFDFLKKRRLAAYLRSVGSYVDRTFQPEPPKPEPPKPEPPKPEPPKPEPPKPEPPKPEPPKPEPPKPEPPKPSGIRYSQRGGGPAPFELDDRKPKVRYHGEVYTVELPAKPRDTEERYSHHETDADKPDDQFSIVSIPNEGDHFAPEPVRTFLSQNADNPRLSGLSDRLNRYLDLTFVDMLTRYINEKGWRDSRVYKAAQMDRRLFSKMMSDRNYKPSKDTVLALVIALELNLTQANDLLSRAGYTLSHSNKRDVIIEYFIRERIYALSDINEILFRLDEKIIGR